MKPVDHARNALAFLEDETHQHVCPVQIDIDEQIYAWREVMGDTGGFSTTKKAAMKVADAVLSHPRVYRAAAEHGGAVLRVLPNFAIYYRLNAWGRHREVPGAPEATFHQWYARNRKKDTDDGHA
jgi:L-lactate dehydrogenase complex protein LldF